MAAPSTVVSAAAANNNKNNDAVAATPDLQPATPTRPATPSKAINGSDEENGGGNKKAKSEVLSVPKSPNCNNKKTGKGGAHRKGSAVKKHRQQHNANRRR